MLPVEIVPVDGKTLVLRARGSELLILPHHISYLRSCKTPKDFTSYFLATALLNRPARKLFEAWLRKDKSLWQRVYKTIKDEMAAADDEPKPEPAPEPAPKAEEKPKESAKKPEKKVEKKVAKKKPAAKKAKPAAKKTKTAKPKKAKPAAKKKAAKKKKA